jgi:ribosomal protein S18 acetylase RimI-like enzyme
MSIQVVEVNESHIQGFRDVLDSVARERKYLAQQEAQPIESVRAYIMSCIAKDAALFVAVDGSLTVGWCDILPLWAHAVQHRGTLGMGVIAGYRGRGIGKQLLTACLEKAKAKGITRVELEVRSDNTAAIELYRKLSFSHEATLHHAMRIDGTYYNAIQMARMI